MESEGQKLITAYHGTDENCVNDILNNEFIVKHNKTHWLGNGVYFYLERSLASWWANSPTKRFGTGKKNTSPAIIKVEIKCPEEQLLDTRSPSQYDELVELYETFIGELMSGGTLINGIDEDELRCSFFDWIVSNYEIDVFIVGFYRKRKDDDDLRMKFRIYYNEYQLCLFNQSLIVTKERIDVR